MIWTCKADGVVVATVDSADFENPDLAWAHTQKIAHDHTGAHYEVYDENGELEMASPVGVT